MASRIVRNPTDRDRRPAMFVESHAAAHASRPVKGDPTSHYFGVTILIAVDAPAIGCQVPAYGTKNYRRIAMVSAENAATLGPGIVVDPA